MKIDLDDRHTIITDRWGYPVLITHKAGVPAVENLMLVIGSQLALMANTGPLRMTFFGERMRR